METNSGRRSSLKEHQFIEKVFKQTLVQKGILYEDKGILYRDYCSPFNLVNTLRKCIRLYQEGQYTQGEKCWREEVGAAQGEEVWLLQKLCEKNRPFLDKNHKSPNRDFMIAKFNANKDETVSVFEKGVIKISGFAIDNGRGFASWGFLGPMAGFWFLPCVVHNLVDLCWLIGNAKANVFESKVEQEVQMSCTC